MAAGWDRPTAGLRELRAGGGRANRPNALITTPPVRDLRRRAARFLLRWLRRDALSSVKFEGPAVPSQERDLRLDFFRGLALIFIFIDHIPENVLSYFTLQAFQFYDAAEVFIFISGYTAALVYGRTLALQGAFYYGGSVPMPHSGSSSRAQPCLHSSAISASTFFAVSP